MISNLGNAILMISMIRATKIGITIKTTTASLAFITIAMIRAPINNPGARSIMRSAILIRFCTCVMSLVSLVTKDPVLNWSRLENENFCTLSNRSLLKSEEKLIAAFAAK